MMPDRSVLFGCGLGAWNGVDVGRAADSARLAAQAERGAARRAPLMQRVSVALPRLSARCARGVKTLG
jgi:hypothetical protein